ncbi:hypothetical protein LSH36_17g08085 [Paralvinella palmiformis]|uniref:MD-2-related lipid-recognition domain-containing protein n=1 Tax=Paralvinella palmiformis TaxID=53620 RepID=A0AAD9KBP1_9ANNE|nr:hypothetical protein LSH36_17g08085 [Paralvinella palmiformis]
MNVSVGVLLVQARQIMKYIFPGDQNAHLTIMDCPEEAGTALNPCLLEQGKTYKFKLTFTPDRDEANPTVKASGSALGVSREIPISMLGDGYHSNPCDSDADDSGIQCPLKANTENSYTLKLPITSEMKRIAVSAQFEINGSDGGDPIVCLRTEVKAV